MKKLKLDVDGLRVETFEPAAAAGPRGTVMGLVTYSCDYICHELAGTGDPIQNTCDHATCAGASCGFTCNYATCGCPGPPDDTATDRPLDLSCHGMCVVE